MSELLHTNDNRTTIRWKLLTGASALALTAYVSSANVAKAEDTSHPQIWIELDGQFSKQVTDEDVFVPSFVLASPFDAASHPGLEKGPPTIWDKGAKISFQPDGSDWVLSASIRYGKNSRTENRHQLTTQLTSTLFGAFYQAYQNFAASSSESHMMVDFQVGKDVGLGRFGSDGRSILSAGVRIAQFNSHGHVGIQSQPTNSLYYYHRFYESFTAKRSFRGVGPSLSWDASATIAGNPSDASITFDWGVNGAILLGRQRAQTHHQTTNVAVPFYTHGALHKRIPVSHPTSLPPARSKNVTVPNLGGFAGLSWRTPNAKISLGYRADMFFGAIDGGLAARKTENRGFYGPFASISIGIGD